MIKIEDDVFYNPNLKPESFYKEFYGKWIVKQYMQYFAFGIKFYVKTLEECIQLQKEHDEMIDTNQFKEDLKYDISGRKEFIIQNNSIQKNTELLIKYEQNQLSCELEAEEKDLEFIKLTKKLIKKCFLILDKGYLITNQLFILDKWFDKPPEVSVFEIEMDVDEDDSF